MPMIEKRATFKANSTEERELEYLVYIPEGYHSNNEPYPLVLFLHGAGERGNDLDLLKIHGIPKMVKGGRNFPFITIAPQCPPEGRKLKKKALNIDDRKLPSSSQGAQMIISAKLHR